MRKLGLIALLAAGLLALALLPETVLGPHLAPLRRLAADIDVGGIRIPLIRILGALVVLVAAVMLTRLVVRGVDRAVPATGVDTGVRHSVLAVLGYAGYALAALLAVATAGLDITNLAIVAGALSVGIGFGLQSIVNNFVSGLILLVERPLKVGDWVIVKDREGIVQRISFRATEIETFDRASVIVPNSDLVGGTLVNLTHRGSAGRLVVKVRVSYRADPERVIALLAEAAEKTPGLLADPPPRVSIDALGPDGMELAVQVFLADIRGRVDVQTQLRIRIFKALQSAGIEISHAQSDVHLRDLDGIRQLVTQALAQRAARAAMDGLKTVDEPAPKPQEPRAAGGAG